MNPSTVGARWLPLLLVWILSPLLLSGCTPAQFPGPQLQGPPPGFLREPEAGQERRMFPDREQIHYDVWVNAAWGDVSTIHINGHPGTVMRADVQGALEQAKQAAGQDPVNFSGVQELNIDGRMAWGWAERFETPRIGLQTIAFRVAIPYDTITYTVEIVSGDPALKRNPDTLLVIASSFGIGETTWNIPLIVGVVLVLVLVVTALKKRAAAREARMRSITLKKVEVKEEEKDGEDGPGRRPMGGSPGQVLETPGAAGGIHGQGSRSEPTISSGGGEGEG